MFHCFSVTVTGVSISVQLVICIFQVLVGIIYDSMADAFSSSSETVLQRLVDVSLKTNTPEEKLEEQYQIRETCDFINERQFKKVRNTLS